MDRVIETRTFQFLAVDLAELSTTVDLIRASLPPHTLDKLETHIDLSGGDSTAVTLVVSID